MEPAPVSWPPSQYWDGDVGSWSSFALRVGSPQQTVRVIPSTACQATWVISPAGCPPGEPGTSASSSCQDSRGGLFNASQSDSWHVLSNNSLGTEANLVDADLTALYGLDTITLGFSDSIGGLKLDSQVVTALAPELYFVGLFGLNHQATNLTNFTDPHPSALTTMKEKNLIPSLSWGYTAGAQYQSKGAFGSLTFGGYDASRFIPNSVSFNLAADITRDLVVGVQSIISTTADQSIRSLLRSPILTFIDSTQPFIYLPLESCLAFEDAFGLVWNQTHEIYWVNDTLHQTLLTSNPNITFKLGDSVSPGPTVDIALPYISFDLLATSPAVTENSRFFPLRRAANKTQYTLGRAFMQETYVIVDYERANFTVSQAKFEDGVSASIVAINSTSPTLKPVESMHPAAPSHGHMGHQIIIGSSIGAFIFLLVAVTAVLWCIRRKKTKSQMPSEIKVPEHSTPERSPRPLSFHSALEIDENSIIGLVRELPDSDKAELQDAHSRTGSRNEISAIVESLANTAYELRTHRSSLERLRLESNRRNPRRILKSTQLSRQRCISVRSENSMSVVATTISMSTHHSIDRSSSDSDSLKIQIYASYIRRPLDLNRTLPPTPICQSPMVSPSTPRLDSHPSLRGPSQRVVPASRPSTSRFISPISPQTAISKYSPTHSCRNGSTSLRSPEPVVSPLSFRQQGERTHWGWLNDNVQTGPPSAFIVVSGDLSSGF